MLKIKPVRGALALLLAVSLCLAMSLTAFLIDTPAMREHAEQAVDLLGYESASPEIVGGFASSRLDNYTAVLILKTAAYIGDDPLLRMAFSGLRTDLPPQEDQTDWEAYATYSDAVPSPNNVPYSRYWHGYTFALRLLLCLFTFTNLQMLLLFAQTALLLLTVLLMVRRGLQQLIPAFAVSWFFMSPPALGLCLQYVPVSLIALLACSLLLALKPALSRSVGLPVFFALIGLFVNYFDLLTFPVVSLSFPLILLIALETKTTISFGGLMREALLCCVGWALGYACMWMLKWGLNFLVLGQDGIAAVGDQISLRLSAGGESHSRLDILLRNIRIVTDKTAYRVILLAALALFYLFRGLDLGCVRWVNALAGTTLGVYILHQVPAFRGFLWNGLLQAEAHHGSVGYTLLAILAVFLGCAAVDALRTVLVMRPLENTRLFKVLCEKGDALAAKITADD